MQTKHKLRIYITAGILTLLLAVGVCLLLFLRAPYGFARPVEEHEAQLRLHFVETAEQWLGTEGGLIKVIEGNCNNRVAYRYIPMDSYQIRGFALPDFSTK